MISINRISSAGRTASFDASRSARNFARLMSVVESIRDATRATAMACSRLRAGSQSASMSRLRPINSLIR
jgi:hypothetical protein